LLQFTYIFWNLPTSIKKGLPWYNRERSG